jgi:hypothetical protein
MDHRGLELRITQQIQKVGHSVEFEVVLVVWPIGGFFVVDAIKQVV